MNRQYPYLIERIEASGKEFLHYLGRLPQEEIHKAPPGEWSVHAVVAHLRDTEEHVFYGRIRRILSEAKPPAVENFDQVQWNRDHYSADEPLKKIVSDFRAARRKELRLLRQTSDKDWSRYAMHPEYGRISIEFIATHNYLHTLEHLHQLLEMRERALLRELNA